MVQKTRDRSLGDGVYFAADDYVGLGPRVVILFVDTVVLIAIVWLLSFVWLSFKDDYTAVFVGLTTLTIWFYVVPLKRSSIRTVGYQLVGAKLVTLQGGRPSLFMLTFRSLLWVLGPFNLLFDLIWCGIDDDRQTMRDRYSYMCLVKNSAQPIGTGEIHVAYCYAMGYNFAYPRVVHPKVVSGQTGVGVRHATEQSDAPEPRSGAV
jgi:uncharacterized RDD family membrane protein YckC